MNSYHKTIWETKRWIDEDTMSFKVPLGLKQYESIVDVEIPGKSLFIASSEISEDKQRLTLHFDKEKVIETCKKETFYQGWELLSCECCTERFELTEDEYDPNNEHLHVEKVTTMYLVPIPTMRITISY